ncbi:unnamed protein product [Miscanthus lutarioriparius]|uniref:Uncharacterized protein n=1 Tax=Miscanthus lutarioriparius TaxID=422564 RepID=A0A811RVR8_9POAL|nr:unnamed protein product [Miscanthus lutarioriparius]
MSSKKAAEGSSKLGRWLGAPVRALSRACDSYVRGMSACAGRMPMPEGAYAGRGGLAPGTLHAATFSRSRGGDEEDLNELVRALSLSQAAASAAATTVPVRSRSVAVGRIDEDAPCEFGADDVVRIGGPAVRRARSVALGSAGLDARTGYGPAYKLGAGVVRG